MIVRKCVTIKIDRPSTPRVHGKETNMSAYVYVTLPYK